MKKILLIIMLVLFHYLELQGQSSLTVRQIMQDPKTWVGTSPSRIFWSEDGKALYFNWNPDANLGDSLYAVQMSNPDHIEKVHPETRRLLPGKRGGYNNERTQKVYARNGDIYVYDIPSGNEAQITNTVGRISNPRFSYDERSVHFQMDNNLFAWNRSSGAIAQLTNFKSGKEQRDKSLSEQDQWLENQQLELMQILKDQKERRESREDISDSNSSKRPKEIYIGEARASNMHMSADGRYITYSLFFRARDSKKTDVPDYITESGYTHNRSARAKVGSNQSSMEVWIYDLELDTAYKVQSKDLPGIKDTPDYYSDYEKYRNVEPKERPVYTYEPIWSSDGTKATVVFQSKDNKDRWIAAVNFEDGSVDVLDRQRDEAWIAGPGIGWAGFGMGEVGWMPDNSTIWFQSEESGFSHLYTVEAATGKKRALTNGNFEIYNPRISINEDYWYFEANPDYPGIRNFYRMKLSGGKMEQITDMGGGIVVILSPDETQLAIRHSKANSPWELFLMPNQVAAQVRKITNSTTDQFRSYDWSSPEFISFKARDGARVHARLYKPDNPHPDRPAVIFVHGAGYLQNAHQWWSSYFREYMFHNLLADHGYTVLDIDYRGSAGYGRDWRAAIYRHMGGWDLNDQVDGTKYLIEQHGVNADRVGIYGGSYGGFITLMALFNESGTFAAGAALRSVTDWAHYNHPYTANILNTPVQDSLAYARSSPINFAEGLEDPLLICHGVVDTNVQFQDVIRLAQRLIELEKENWEMAIFPVEGHGFVEPSSWADEYSRIFKLFEENLKD